jgi:hypothetical protein
LKRPGDPPLAHSTALRFCFRRFTHDEASSLSNQSVAQIAEDVLVSLDRTWQLNSVARHLMEERWVSVSAKLRDLMEINTKDGAQRSNRQRGSAGS